VPPAFAALFSAPYLLGEGLVYSVGLEGGWPAVDDLLRAPPTEEELFNPAVRGTGRGQPVTVAASAPEGAEVLVDDTLGPIVLYLMLASRGVPVDAFRAVEGWAGDHLVLYRADGKVCAEASIATDGPAATDLLYRSLLQWAAKSPPGTVHVSREADELGLRACDPGPSAPSGGEVKRELLLVPALRAPLHLFARELGQLDEEQANCVVDAMLRSLPLDDLGGLDLVTPSPELEQAARSAAEECA
jgi:hypothetical protein